jgi:succinate dehydrogenase / fumarate reductase membrane anchor subunit
VAIPSAGRRLKPSGGFELQAWYFMRISGLILVLLALGHLCVVHILYNVEVINYAFVANRWTRPGTGVVWRLWDLTMVVLAMIHGLNGLRQVLDEYITRPASRVVAHTMIWSLATLLVGMGSYAILMFEPDHDYIRDHPRKDQPAAVVTAGARAR